MSFIDKSWFWLLAAAVVYAILFLLSYLNSKFSTLSILLLITAIALLVITLLTGISTKIKNDLIKGKQLFQQKLSSDINAQKQFTRGALEAIASVGQATIEIGKQVGSGTIKESKKQFGSIYKWKGGQKLEKEYLNKRKIERA